MDALGWDEAWASAFALLATPGRRPARVVAVHKETAIVRDAAGDVPATVSGRFRHEVLAASDYPAVGDWVVLEPASGNAGGGDPATIAAILPRRTSFRRQASDASRRNASGLAAEQVMATNVDVAFLMAGLDSDFNLRRLERYLAVTAASAIVPVVVLNKADIGIDIEGRLVAVGAIAPGIPVVVLSALTGDHISDLAPYLHPGRTAVILGSSGVGKSTLLNTLLGESRQATAAVRGSDSRGRHTTTHRELFMLPGGALLIDTPGIRSLEVVGAEAGLEETFDDIEALALACRFGDCRHAGEPGCAVTAALASGTLAPERLASARKLEREAAHAERKVDPRAQAAERRRWGLIQKSAKRHMKSKYYEAEGVWPCCS